MVALTRSSSKPRKRRWYHRRDVRFLIVIGALLVIYFGAGFVQGPSRISESLHEKLGEDPKTVNIEVTTEFPPEAFHMGVYQNLGSVRGSKGNTTTLFRVKPADVRWLSRKYWIERIDLAPDPKR